MWKHYMYAIMSDLGKYLVNRCALCLKGSNMPRPPLNNFFASKSSLFADDAIVGMHYHNLWRSNFCEWPSDIPESPDWINIIGGYIMVDES